MTDDPPLASPDTQPATVAIEQGMVLLDGEGGLAATMTPATARVTGERLIAAAVEVLAATAAGEH